MDGVRRPVGEEPAEVYWRRRLTALIAVVLAVAVIIFLIVSPGGDEKAKPTGPASATSPAATTSAAPTAGASAACAASSVTVTVAPNPFTVPTGGLPVFDVSVENKGTNTCTLDTQAEGTSLSIRSGDEVYYSTTLCPADATITPRVFSLEPGKPQSFQLTWNRSRVTEGCAANGSTGAGFYWISLSLQGAAAPEAQFQIQG